MTLSSRWLIPRPFSVKTAPTRWRLSGRTMHRQPARSGTKRRSNCRPRRYLEAVARRRAAGRSGKVDGRRSSKPRGRAPGRRRENRLKRKRRRRSRCGIVHFEGGHARRCCKILTEILVQNHFFFVFSTLSSFLNLVQNERMRHFGVSMVEDASLFLTESLVV